MIPRRLNLTRFFGIIAIIAVTVGSGILLTACGKKPMDKIEVASGMPTNIVANRTISWDNLIIKITRTNDKTEEVKYKDEKDSFDVPTVIETAGTKNVTISYTEKNTTKSVDVSVTVAPEPEMDADTMAVGFSAPVLAASHYSTSTVKYALGDEAAADVASTETFFEVGDDNLFLIAPVIEVEKDSAESVWNGSYNNMFEYKLQVKNGNAFEDVTASDYLDTVDMARCGFDFKDGTATNKTFKLSITPSVQIKNEFIETNGFDFTFTVRDGWNAYDLRDLQLLSNRGYYRYSLDGELDGLVKHDNDHLDATWDGTYDQIDAFADMHSAALANDGRDWQKTESGTDYFWGTYRNANVDEYLASMTTIRVPENYVWGNKAGQRHDDEYKTLAKYLAKTIKGMYLQSNVTILQENSNGDNRQTLPTQFMADKATAGDANLLARGVAIFDHITPDGEKFTFNGNYFQINARDILIEKTGDGDTWGTISYGTLFNFGETQNGTGVESEAFYEALGVTFKNLEINGNSKRLVDAAAAEEKEGASVMSLSALGVSGIAGDGVVISRVIFNETKSVVNIDKRHTHTYITDSKVTIRDCKVNNLYASPIASSSFCDEYLFHNDFTNVNAPTSMTVLRLDVPVVEDDDRTHWDYGTLWANYRVYQEYNDNRQTAFGKTDVLLQPEAAQVDKYIDTYTMNHSTEYINENTSLWVKQMMAMLGAQIEGMTVDQMLPPDGLIPGYSVFDNITDKKFAVPFLMSFPNIDGNPNYNLKNINGTHVVDNETGMNKILSMSGETEITTALDVITIATLGGQDSSYFTLVGENGTFVAWLPQGGETDRTNANSTGWMKGKLLSSFSDAEIAILAASMSMDPTTTARADVIAAYQTARGGISFMPLANYQDIVGGVAQAAQQDVTAAVTAATDQFWKDVRHEKAGNTQPYAFLYIKMGDTIFNICVELRSTATEQGE